MAKAGFDRAKQNFESPYLTPPRFA